MLVLTRRVDETVVIDERITITVVKLLDGKVRLGIDAPEEMNIRRGELPPKPEEGDA